MQKLNKKGFTIIELLVVIVIIGILVALTLPNLFAAQARGRDTDRKNELKNLQQQLETYFGDNGSYPGEDTSAMVAVLGGAATDDQYVSPKNEAYVYTALPAGCTTATNDCTSFTLSTTLENLDDNDGTPGDGTDPNTYTLSSVNQ